MISEISSTPKTFVAYWCVYGDLDAIIHGEASISHYSQDSDTGASGGMV
jgi:hypothetical protein